MEHDDDADHPAEAAGPGSFEDLFAELEDFDPDDIDSDQVYFLARERLAGREFSLSPDEFDYFLEHFGDLHDKVRGFGYDSGLLYFEETKTIIHQGITRLFHQFFAVATLNIPTWLAEHGAAAVPIPSHLGSQFAVCYWDEEGQIAFFKYPDMDAGVALDPDTDVINPTPILVVEISYAHRFSRPRLEDRYQAHLTRSQGQVKAVICVDIYYGRGQQRAEQTAQHLDRSSIAMWVTDDHGQVQTVVDWVPLS